MVVDDSAVIRGSLARFLEADRKISTVASVSNGQMALDRLGRTDVEIVMLDIEMPVMDGMTALPLILGKKPGIQVLMTSALTRKNAKISLRAPSLGAADYVPRPATAEPAAAAVPAKSLLGSRRPITLRRQPVASPDLIAIGSSTGGPRALLKILGD
jgi:two-component system chemotaxis response regulator CheB